MLLQDARVTQNGLDRRRQLISRLAMLFLLTIGYFIAGKLGLRLAFVNPSATPIWPPTGIAIAAFLIIGDLAGPAILVGAFLVNVTTSGSIPTSIAIAIGNTLEGLFGAYLVKRFAHGEHVFDSAQDIFRYTIFAGMLCTALSATVGVTSLLWSGLVTAPDYSAVWFTWWLGDAGGSLIVAPALILWAREPKLRWTASRGLEASLLLACLLLLSLAVFGIQSPLADRNYALEFTFMPIIIWAAYRFYQRGAATVTLILSAIAILGTLQGTGPFARALPNESLLLVQSFMGTVAITGLVLAALVAERHQVEEGRDETNEKLRQSLEELATRGRNMGLLNEMSDLLQSCLTFEEAYAIIGQFGRRLLADESGALYMINAPQDRVEAAVTWGLPASEPDAFSMQDCWALRRGRTHTYAADQSGVELLCPHLKHRPPAASQCIMMMAQGETMGILHIRSRAPADTGADQGQLGRYEQQIASAMADRIVLALANLKLRIFLREQSIRDPLTDLFNRRYLEETLEREFHRAQRLQRSVGVLMLDLDHFKLFNDKYGHGAGDALLRALSGFLKENIRGGDIACRFGGEEFALILPEMSLEHVLERAEQLREGIKLLNIRHQGQSLPPPTLSVGVAMFPDHGSLSQTVLNAADAALYSAKRLGRDRVVVADQRAAEGTSVE